MYYHRLLEEKLVRMANHFKTVLVVGARQVGKSTILAHCFPNYKHITFDAITDDYAAKSDPVRFLNNFKPPIILDEIQYCPELLSPLKRYVDQLDVMGQYLLTGSQNLSAIKNAAESMAGRVAIMQLDALMIDEIAQTNRKLLFSYLANADDLVRRFDGRLPLKHSLYEMIWRGGMPDILRLDNQDISDYFASYLQTYVERDVRLLENIQNLTEFDRFVRLSAAATAQEINYSQLGRELGIARQTATSWLSVLQHTYQWVVVPPYHGNAIKRITQKPKGYLSDTGMACFLQRISSPEALASHPMLGALFENFIAMDLIKQANTISTSPVIYHWRTNGGAEVDLIFERDGCLYPVEIKCKSQLTRRDASGIKAFLETYAGRSIGKGLIIYAGNECFALDDNIIALPWDAAFEP